jgi:hypothetical protein
MPLAALIIGGILVLLGIMISKKGINLGITIAKCNKKNPGNRILIDNCYAKATDLLSRYSVSGSKSVESSHTTVPLNTFAFLQ